VPPEDPSALAAALVRLSQDADLRARLVAGGRQRFAERFTAERFTVALAGAYAELGFEP
jgi:glycosyltransferase involved in cell wall biosynthesis